MDNSIAQSAVSQSVFTATLWTGGIFAVGYSCYVAHIEFETQDPHGCCGGHYPGKENMPRCPFMDAEPYTPNFLEWRKMRYQRYRRCRQLGCAHKPGCENVKAVPEWLPPIGCESYTEIKPNWFRSPDGNRETQGRKNPAFKKRAYGSRNAGNEYVKQKNEPQVPKPAKGQKTTIRKRVVVE